MGHDLRARIRIRRTGSPGRRTALAGVATLAVLGMALGGVGGARASIATQGAAADAHGISASLSVAGSTPIAIGPLAQSGADEPGGTAASTANVANCNNCVPGVLSSGVIDTSSAATLTSAANNCTTAAGFPVNNLIALNTNPSITGGSACASVASPAASLAGATALFAADVVETNSVTDSCSALPKGYAGIVGLSILGTTIPISALPVNLGPNTDIGNILPSVPVVGPALKTLLQTLGVTIILNEEHYDANGHGLTVNGVHIIISKAIGTIAAADIVIAHSHSQATCTSGQTNTGNTPNPCSPTGCTTAPVTPVITKLDSTSTVAPGGSLRYSVVVNQRLTDCGQLTIVTDTLPPGFTYVAPPVSGPLGSPVTGTQGGSGRQTVTWENLQGFGALTDPVVEVITVAVSPAEAAGATYFNEVDATSQDCGTVHGTDGGVTVTAVATPTPTPTATAAPPVSTLPNTSATAAPWSGATDAVVILGGGALALAATALGIRSRRRE